MTTKGNLLIVDSDPKSLRVLEVSLRKAGYGIATAENGREAIAEVHKTPPDLIISNTMMPEMDGFELLKSLKADPALAAIPFIFLTSHKSIEDKIKGLELGVEDYLTKPIFVREILTRVNMLLQRRERESLGRRDTKTKFSGRLSDMGIVDLIQTIDIGRKTGIIHLNNGRETGAIFFRDGKVIDAEVGARRGADAVYRFLFWPDGSFEIDFRNVRRETRIDLSTQGLLMEGMRRVDEWGFLIDQLPSMDVAWDVDPVRLKEKLDEIPDEVNEVLRHFDGKKTLMEVMDASIMGDVETLAVLVKLHRHGLLFPVAPQAAASVGEILAKTDDAEVARFPVTSPDETEEHTLPPIFSMRSATDPKQRFQTDDRSRWDLTPPGIPVPFPSSEPGSDRIQEPGTQEPKAEPADPQPRGSFSPALAFHRRRRRKIRKATAPFSVPVTKAVETPKTTRTGAGPEGSDDAIPSVSDASSHSTSPPTSIWEPGVPETTGAPSPPSDIQTGAWEPMAVKPSSLVNTQPGSFAAPSLSQTYPMGTMAGPSSEGAERKISVVPRPPFPPVREESPSPVDVLGSAPKDAPVSISPARERDADSDLPSVIVTDDALRQNTVQVDGVVWKEPEEDRSAPDDGIHDFHDLNPMDAGTGSPPRARMAVILLLGLIGLSVVAFGVYYFFFLAPEKALIAAFESAEARSAPVERPLKSKSVSKAPRKAEKVQPKVVAKPAIPAHSAQPDPRNVERYNQLLKEAQTSGSRKKADLYREALDAYPAGHEAMVRLAALLMEDGESRDEALLLAEKGVALAPSSSLGWLVIGYLKQVANDVDGSAEAYERCVEITPPDRYTRECKLMMRSIRR